MKVVSLAVVFIVSIVAAFAGGAYLSFHYFVNPLLDRSTWFERDMFNLQVHALSRLQSGSAQEAQEYLRARNAYSLSMLAIDEEAVKGIKRSPTFLESAVTACEDIAKNSTDTVSTGKQKAAVKAACATLLSKAEPTSK
jgi:hypothetical protein